MNIKEENKDCWLFKFCNHKDCDKFCLRKFKQNYLYDMGLITMNQRQHIDLYVDNDLSDLDAFKQLSQIEKNIEDFVKNGQNLYIYSQFCGNGKTSWALRMTQAYINAIWYKTPLICKVLFISVPRFLLELKSNITTPSEYVSHIKENVLNADLVVWDELGTKSLTEFEHENVLSLVNARLNLQKSNIYTSNLKNEELLESVGERLYSRVYNSSVVIQLLGKDKRTLK